MMNAQRDDAGAPDHEPVGDHSYMAASRELDEIVEFFEKSEVDVDQLVTRLERATAIVDELDRRIRRTRAQVEELVPKLEAAGRAAADTAVGEGVGGDDDGTDPAAVVRVEDRASDGETLPF
jgi:exodeoxyribonuclease VII small subunit